jgi:hypothetical protein
MATSPSGVYRAVVAAITGTTAKVTITRLGGPNVYVDARILLPVGGPDATFAATSLALGDDTLPLRPLEAGDEVLVAFLEGDRDHPIVLGRLA